MNQEFKTETFRDDFTFSNSPEAIRRFPFPFREDKYMYSVNIEPHTKGPAGSMYEFPIDIDEHYVSEMQDRALVLEEDPLRCQSLPHMMLAEWDLLELLMTTMARDYPEFHAAARRPKWHWINRPLGIDQSFIFGDSRHSAARADGVHHAAMPGRFLHSSTSGRQSLDGCGHGHHAGRLVARLSTSA